MNLAEYFAQTDGTVILSTANGEGKVDAAVYSKPRLIQEDSLALLMSDRLSHANIQANPYAVLLFLENGPGWHGKRIYLKKIKEEKNTELARSLVHHKHGDVENINVNLVYFQIEEVRPLVGD